LNNNTNEVRNEETTGKKIWRQNYKREIIKEKNTLMWCRREEIKGLHVSLSLTRT
jgi:hypothetical protein